MLALFPRSLIGNPVFPAYALGRSMAASAWSLPAAAGDLLSNFYFIISSFPVRRNVPSCHPRKNSRAETKSQHEHPGSSAHDESDGS